VTLQHSAKLEVIAINIGVHFCILITRQCPTHIIELFGVIFKTQFHINEV